MKTSIFTGTEQSSTATGTGSWDSAPEALPGVSTCNSSTVPGSVQPKMRTVDYQVAYLLVIGYQNPLTSIVILRRIHDSVARDQFYRTGLIARNYM